MRVIEHEASKARNHIHISLLNGPVNESRDMYMTIIVCSRASHVSVPASTGTGDSSKRGYGPSAVRDRDSKQQQRGSSGAGEWPCHQIAHVRVPMQ